ncbi:sterol desaturase family protein [Aquincola sp. S2]|uniref:Sterol desaturase family protein n=1 Tax=Pseudaquabacterium terrae TaxID=2732868 RepID=A0ABX2ET64_9BURK|nr:sterol desaturase family protein [Aquabacterium terrae]NRF71798.1 sterol desaturase family protein [Aquabacterium terrae]
MVRFLTRHLYLLAVAGGGISFALGHLLGWPLEAVVLGWSLAILAAGIALERLAPFDAGWSRARGDTATDATSAALLIGAVDPLLKAVLPIAAIALLGERATPWALGDWPLALQITAAVLWIEFAKYWMHRAHHEHPVLWQLHALHHGSERLYWLNNFRLHPLNHVLNTVVSLLPLWLAGAPEVVLLGATALTQPLLMLQHANIDLKSGWLNGILSTNEVHRWHHSTQPHEANANYGSALVLWDHVFGTYRGPSGRGRPERIGLFGEGHGFPARASYWRQLIGAWQPACCRA